MSKRYFEAYNRLLSLSNLEQVWAHSSKTSLESSLIRTKQVLKRLGNPEKALKFVHVTGTSGKGSVTQLMHEILRRSGEKVASYSSPHTTTFLERFRIDDKLAAPDALAHAIEDLIAAHEEHVLSSKEPLTFFELSTCLAFLLFQRAGAEWCVLEVGMGGRYDSTNVIPAPAVAIITNIDLDHTDFLGPTTSDIAREKSGIIKPGCLVVTGETSAKPLKIISDEAKKQQAPLLVIPDETHDHLEHNADIARAAGLLLGMSPLAIELAIENTKPLPCRLEVMQTSPLVILDGAHNGAKIRATCAKVRDLSLRSSTSRSNEGGKVHLIFGCKKLKDAESMSKELVEIADTVRTTRFTQGYGKPENPQDLLELFPKRLRERAFLFPHEALADALKVAKKSDTILVTGSLYLAGELRTHWRSEAQILHDQQS